jgi:hypothetical protein
VKNVGRLSLGSFGLKADRPIQRHVFTGFESWTKMTTIISKALREICRLARLVEDGFAEVVAGRHSIGK